MNGEWYKEMAVYQIWIRSFCDGNGDGIGDLWGVLSKLEYIQSLNVDGIWFSPIYPSPNADFGYDVSDYYDINPDYGTLELFKEVLAKAHKLGLRVFMDLVINHTSDEHPWFQESRKSRDNPYRNYYYWRSGKTAGGKRLPPNNWTSQFEGDAWEYDPRTDEYYLHVFSRKQPDLNMSNPEVREEVKKIMRFWLDIGVDGFREDVITYIAKAPGLPDSYPKIPAANGMKYYSNRPEAYVYLQEFQHDVLSGYDCFTIGEGALLKPEEALRYIEEGPNQVLNEMIDFSHMQADCYLTDFLHRRFSLVRMKKAFSNWQNRLGDRAWPSLYIENHDHPRIISRYGSERYHDESGKMLAAMYLLQRGTPFVYQGQEIGMTNHALPDVNMYQDIQARNWARIAEKVMPRRKVLELVQVSSRDNARTPVQWTAGEHAGFSEAEPWFPVNPNYTKINVEAQEQDPDSLLNFYRKLIKFRKEMPVVLRGDYKEYEPGNKELYIYSREYRAVRLLVICSFSAEGVRFDAPEKFRLNDGVLMFSNYDRNFIISNGFTARPYEMRVYLFE